MESYSTIIAANDLPPSVPSLTLGTKSNSWSAELRVEALVLDIHNVGWAWLFGDLKQPIRSLSLL